MSPSKVNGEISLIKGPYRNAVDALRHEAKRNAEGIVAYPPNDISEPSAAYHLSYKDLLHQAEGNASRLLERKISTAGSIVLLHFETNLDSIIWYWSVLLTGAVPVITGPGMFSPNAGDRKKHLIHLHRTLGAPNCLTRQALKAPFAEQTGDARIECFVIEDLFGSPVTEAVPAIEPAPSDTLALMLTSGSSGQAKAVPLTHRQLLAAFEGKTATANLQYPQNPFLSWVHMDHVANLVHCHLFAIVSGVSQIQVSAADVLVDPVQWLNLLSRHRVSRTFAPNFLFAKLRRQLAAGKTEGLDADLNLEALYLDTGGEANVIDVCVALQELLKPYRISKDVFKPSFGMTETCAGCIFNSNCPSDDRAGNYEFASLGEPMPGVQMRVTRLDGSGEEAAPGERGSLEVTGEVIFEGYHNNEIATAEAFTSDGWFRTGDLAYLDAQGRLHLDGRTKEIININGVKYLPHELDAALEEAEIPSTTPTYFCCFGTRDATMDTEVVAVLYLPSFDAEDDKARFETQSSIIRVASLHTHSRPKVVPLRLQDMPKSTLGKLSRTKLQAALEGGQFTEQQKLNDEAIKRYRQNTRGHVETTEEAVMLDIVRDQLEVCTDDDFGVNDSLLATGATSMDLVAIMQRINRKLQLSPALRLTDVLNHPTVRGLASRIAVTTGQVPHEYDPVVTLQPFGHKTPLWLVHPGVGEVLVFVTLAHHFTDRPVYAFRAKGFNAAEGETPFKSLEEVFETYRSAIKKRQPHGPYAIAGYSFGGMVAFEVTKLLERDGDEVRYCGSWNLPPHIKFRMRELTHKPVLCAFERENKRLEAIRYLRKHCDAARWDELGLPEEYYLLWVGLASNMQGMAVDYEPKGSVRCMDVFVADPLSHVAKDRKDWVESRLAAWKDFVRQDVQFHDVQGAHYTMLNPEYVASFADTLRGVLKQRGV